MGYVIKDMKDKPDPMRPINLYREVELSLEQVDKIKYLMLYKGFNTFNEIGNQALKEYFETEFKKLGIEHYRDLAWEEAERKRKKRWEEENYKAHERKLIKIAKQRLLEAELKKLKAEEAKTGKDLTKEIK